MTKIMKIIGIILLFNIVISFVDISNSNASEHNSILKGEYFFSTNRTCSERPTSDVFNTDLSRSANKSLFVAFCQGRITFNGDGTGSFTFTYLHIRPQEYQEEHCPIKHGSGSGILLYNVNEDKTFTIEMQRTGTNIVAPDPGTIVTESGVWDGWIGHGNQLLSDTQPNIQILTKENGETVERICGRSGIFMRKLMTE